jgi:hypothetical protein
MKIVKNLLSGLALGTAITAVSGCANRPSSYQAYYDNSYGQIYDGYWTGDSFNFRTTQDQPFQNDTAGHFRKDPTQGFGEVKGKLHPGVPAAAPGSAPPTPPQPPQ